MRVQTIYTADDGTDFDTEAECLAYEAKQKRLDEVEPVVGEVRHVMNTATRAVLARTLEHFALVPNSKVDAIKEQIEFARGLIEQLRREGTSSTWSLFEVCVNVIEENLK